MALTPSKSHVTASTVNQAVTKANKNKSTNQHKEAARLARKAAKMATEQGDYHLANHYHRIYEHHSQLANIRKSETKDNPTNMGKNSWEGGASEHIPTHLKQLQSKADAYHKAGDIESANALRNKIKIIKTKHGMAPTSTQKAEDTTEKSETRLSILARGIQAAITLRALVKAEKRIDHDKEAGLTDLDKTPSGHVKVANGHAKAGDYLDYFGSRHKVLGVSKDKRTVTSAPVTTPKGEEPSIKEHLKESHPYYHYNQHRLITSDEAKNGVSKEKGYSIKSSGGGNGVQAAITLRGLVKAETLDKASGLSPENRLKYSQNRAFSSSDIANESNDPEKHSFAQHFHSKSAEVANKLGKPHIAEYHKAIANHHKEVASSPENYKVTKTSSHSGLSPENKIKYSRSRADSSSEIAHGSNDATHHSNAAHFHRKAAEVASSVGHKVLSNYHNNIAKYHENESSGGGNK